MSSLSVEQQYDFICRTAGDFYQKIVGCAGAAHNEAEFERDMNNAISVVARQLDVQLLFRQQYSLATGRADAVYNRFIIEYEPPGSLRGNLSHGHTQHAVQQVKDYIDGVAKEERHDRDRLLGVAFDGHFFIFVRYHDGHFIVEEPLPANAYSTERFLRSLFTLSSGRALIPENLVEDFGGQNLLAHQATCALYNALEHHSDDLTARLYAQWQLFFGEVAGFEASTGKISHQKKLRAFAKGMGLRAQAVDAPRLFFAVHTYFSFLVKNIARLVLQAYAGGSLGTTPLSAIANRDAESLRRELQQMEHGGIFRTLGLKNLLEGDFFSWYISAWDEGIEAGLRPVLSRLAEYNPSTIADDPYSARDLLKKLYHYLLPREIRHDLGEFYTPDWLAERLLTQLGEPLFQLPRLGQSIPTPNKRLLDPACGSGTFLVLAIRALKANCAQAGLAEADTLDVILKSVAGIDLNPLAVLAARVNYLLAVADLLPYRRQEVEIPVYLADSILTPSRGGDLFAQDRRILETAVGKLPVPDVIDSRGEMEKLTGLLEEYVANGFAPAAFLERCRCELPDVAAAPQSETVLQELFERLADLHKRGLDGIWARVLKNAFMPLFLEQFDYVVGNPPWINWESLPTGYREQLAPMWQRYALFEHKGFDAILGKAKDDISALMTYVAADRYLKTGGKLAFVITQSVWKTSGGGQGFRRFHIPSPEQDKRLNLTMGTPLRILHVDDLSSMQVFEGASTRTSVFVMLKGQPTRYPVPYTYWQKTAKRIGLDYDSTPEEVIDIPRRLQFSATPVDGADTTSPWLTARRQALVAIKKVLGTSEYRARHGVNSGGLNAVYWMEVVVQRPDGLIIVRNVTEGAKISVESVTTEIEATLVFPLLRLGELKRWYADPSLSMLLTHYSQDGLNAIAESEMQSNFPKTWAYLKRFETLLRNRSGFQRYFTRQEKGGNISETGPFYSIFNIGEYTFGEWKVVWPNMGKRLDAAVISSKGNRPIVPQHIITLIATQSEQEALYIAAVINSAPFQFAAFSYSQVGGKSFATPQIVENLLIPKFDAESFSHAKLVGVASKAHQLAPLAYAGNADALQQLRQVEADVDRAAAALWGLTEQELADVQTSLQELKGGG